MIELWLVFFRLIRKSWRRTNTHNKWLLLISVLTTAVIAEPQEYPRFGLRVDATELARLNIPVQLNTSVIATPGLSFTSGGNTQNMTERGEDWYKYIRPGLFVDLSLAGRAGETIRPYSGLGCGFVFTTDWHPNGFGFSLEDAPVWIFGGIRYWFSQWGAFYGEGRISCDLLMWDTKHFPLKVGYGFIIFLPRSKG